VRPEHYLELAARYAVRADERGYQLGAVGLRKDGAIVLARNGPIPGEPDDSLVAHAEHRLCRKLDIGATVYVARVSKAGQWAISRPCPVCFARLRARGVRRIYYTINANEYGSITLC